MSGPLARNEQPDADRAAAPQAASATNGQHGLRMKELVQFTALSLETAFPSPFGCAIYNERDGALVAQAYDTVMEMCDPTNHAEINAIRAATRRLRRLSLRGCTLYSTCEPCPMCMSACIWAEVDTVVFGASTMEDANRYWPQSSDMSPQELVSRMRIEPKCRIVPHVERALCQELFIRCDEVRIKRGLKLPPHRTGGTGGFDESA
jgi:tRNA(Arg) A34 adenosine deaminase TadA